MLLPPVVPAEETYLLEPEQINTVLTKWEHRRALSTRASHESYAARYIQFCDDLIEYLQSL
jgi:hypothetical protein